MNKANSTTGNKDGRALAIVMAALGSVLLLASLKLPLWQMRLESPQYQDKEALRIAVHPNAMTGDVKELTVLQQYIGVHIPPTLPQFKWLPALLIGGAALGLFASLLRFSARRRALVGVTCALTAALAFAAIQALVQMRDIGHHRDQKTVLVGVADFTPPFIGTNKIAQFTVSSQLGLGAWLIGGALALQIGAALVGSRRGSKFAGSKVATQEVGRLTAATSNHI